MITSSKTFGNQSGVGFKGDTSNSKTFFIKSGLLTNLIDPSKKGKSVINFVATEGKLVL